MDRISFARMEHGIGIRGEPRCTSIPSPRVASEFEVSLSTTLVIQIRECDLVGTRTRIIFRFDSMKLSELHESYSHGPLSLTSKRPFYVRAQFSPPLSRLRSGDWREHGPAFRETPRPLRSPYPSAHSSLGPRLNSSQHTPTDLERTEPDPTTEKNH